MEMCSQLVKHVQCYLFPSEDEMNNVRFVKQLEQFVSVCIERLLRSFALFSELRVSDEPHVPSLIQSALLSIFPLEFIERAHGYQMQFLNLETSVMLASLSLSVGYQRFVFSHLTDLVTQLSPVIEFAALQLTELFFIMGRNRVAYWQEIHKDPVLHSIHENLQLHAWVRQKNPLQMPELTQHAEELVNSLIATLLIKKCRVL